MNNRESLIGLMSEKGLERREVAELLRVDRDTVGRWLLPTESSRCLEIPDMALELLQIKLADNGEESDEES